MIDCLIKNPTISSVEELCAVLNIVMPEVPEDEVKQAEYLIERNRLRLQVLLKQDLYCKQDLKSKELLYKIICNPEELKRWGIQDKEHKGTTNATIEIKCADPDIMDKIKNL